MNRTSRTQAYGGEIGDIEAAFRGAMPKDATGASRFLEAHPEHDGRGVVCAIFDTGVDPGAAGLQVTSHGLPKVIDIVDCTGSGDVDTSQVVKAEDDKVTLPPVSGGGDYKLKVNPAWKNPSGDWHVGCVRAHKLFSGGLNSMSTKERAKGWAAKQRAAVAEATSALAEFNRSNPSPAEGEPKKQKAELEARVKLLEDLEAARSDQGPLVYCAVWNDGATWRAAVDTSDMYAWAAEEDEGGGNSKGLLADFEPLASFAEERKYGTFSALDACNFGVNVYDEGRTLSIVVDAGAHGTHVAGITAAFHPDDPNLNGVAPGAQIISCKIGDTRLGSMETNTGLSRALIHTLAAKADLVNMSYGESTKTPNAGRFVDLASEVVNKHGVIFVSSAGNSGPALSTVGAPGGTSSAIISVGAYVSADLAAAGHSLREELDPLKGGGQQYTWSSRGPTADGHLGVTLSAPGGAVAPVPNWTQQRRQLMNGTSMASPNACGCIALLLSGLKAEDRPNTPGIVRRALENSCAPVRPGHPDNFLTHGRGLIQVDKAWELLAASAEVDLPSFEYSVKARVAGTSSWGRGVYLREPGEAEGTVNVSVDVDPVMHEKADVATERLAVEHKLLLRPSAPWLRCPEVLLVHHGGRAFEASLDCDALPEGLHFAEIEALDSAAPWRGPLFRVPVTVVKPTSCSPPAPPPSAALLPSSYPQSRPPAPSPVAPWYAASFPSLGFTAGAEHRRFVAVPEGTTWCEMKLVGSLDASHPFGYFVRATQLRPSQTFNAGEGVRAYVQMPPGGEWSKPFAVEGGGTLEVTIAQFWSSLGDSCLSCELDFHGLTASAPSAVLNPSGPVQLEARAPLRREKLSPKGTLTAVQSTLRPSKSTLDALSIPRDTLPDNRVIHQLILTYPLSAPEPGKYTPALPGLTSGWVYDASFEVGAIMMFDANKKLVATWDPSGPSSAHVKKKVDHTIRVSIRHDSAAALEKLRGLVLVMSRALDSALNVPVYGSNDSALKAGETMGTTPLPKGGATALFLGPVPDDKLPKDALPGKTLVGALTLGLCSGSGKASPHSVPLALPCAAAKPKDDANDSSDKKSSKTEAEKLEEAVRDAKVKFLKDLKTDTPEAKDLYSATLKELLSAFPKHLPVLLERMQRLSSDAAKKESPEAGEAAAADPSKALELVVEAADDVVAAIDCNALAVYLARKCDDDEGDESKTAKAEMEEQKAAVIEALACKCAALLDLEANAPEATKDSKDAAEEDSADDRFKAAFTELRKWVDTATDPKQLLLHSRSEERAGRLASAFKVLDKLAEPDDKATDPKIADRQGELLGKLGWGHWERHMLSIKSDSFPTSLPPV